MLSYKSIVRFFTDRDDFAPFFYDFIDTLNDFIGPHSVRSVCHLTNFLWQDCPIPENES
jgi:hypothetical protein